ncbi:bifunctional DNA-formamidopyrimidine glycosylase/DNA-(apurinic or apyrimidinic site) lyase [Acetobacter estunensis]|uniref:bifunctional DNA-formamidopyrimidine glycosylase/DNA-(apurinic or apyrimidinic site) lyase n=1 Tax=Acetobacter estunensis TaxID=104097 RepID=UPI001C2DF140|nr:bifunctional DNA-formamidopyrimidine glycosylase/DNA-(apurinic or apyrimidinic site) lyase [Acetobacter estunensis]MBV1836679.1 bifunctional DNA-formamidopyrimidine glycosylase/DNA-(apurinic or apyrimidinic site) lyase [Acetobacter estunensis]
MPELPEVETVMRGMKAALEGDVIAAASVRRPDLRWPMPVGLADRLAGKRIESFRRRGKYILMRLSGGQSVLLHLGMSGRVNLGEGGSADDVAVPHEHVAFTTRGGKRFGLVDPRRFGALDIVLTAGEDSHCLLGSMGPEPLETAFTGAFLASALAGRRTPIKMALLDQRIVAGLGNIYVCEALYRARIHPATSSALLDRAACDRLVAAVRAVLEEAIAAGGSSLRDYVQPDGELGYFQHAWRVYGREGQPCPDCGVEADKPVCPGIRRITQSGRSTFFCPRLQVESVNKDAASAGKTGRKAVKVKSA